MTISTPDFQARSKALQTLHVILAALAAVVIAIAAQGWPGLMQVAPTEPAAAGSEP